MSVVFCCLFIKGRANFSEVHVEMGRRDREHVFDGPPCQVKLPSKFRGLDYQFENVSINLRATAHAADPSNAEGGSYVCPSISREMVKW